MSSAVELKPRPNVADTLVPPAPAEQSLRLPPAWSIEGIREAATRTDEWRALIGDPAVRSRIFDVLRREFTPPALSKLRDRYGVKITEETTQCVLVALNRLLDSFEGGRSSLTTYLSTWLAPRAIDEMRAEGLQRRHDLAFRRKVAIASVQLRAAGVTHPSEEDLAGALQISPEILRGRLTRQLAQRTLSLDDLAVGHRDFTPTSAPDRASSPATRENRRLLARLYGQLGEELRYVLALRYAEGFDRNEIAAAINSTPGVVSTMLYNGTRELREALGDRRTAQDLLDAPRGFVAVSGRSAALTSLTHELERSDVPPTVAELERWCDGPQFIRNLLTTGEPKVIRWRNGVGLHEAFRLGSSELRQDFTTAFRHLFPTLDHIEVVGGIGKLLGVESNDTGEAARRAIAVGLHSPEMPAGHPPTRIGGRSHYLNPAVIVEPKIYDRNIATFLKSFDNLDSFIRNHPHFEFTASLLEVGLSAKEISRAVVERGIFERAIPAGTPLLGRPPHTTAYVDPDVVGFEQARANLAQWITDSNLPVEELPFAPVRQALNRTKTGDEVEVQDYLTLMRALVERDIVDPERPAGHPFYIRIPQIYFEPEAVGAAWAERNRRALISEHFPTLNEIKQSAPNFTAITRMFGAENAPREFARTLIRLGCFSDLTLPPGASIENGPTVSYYVDPDIVGPAQAEFNLRTFVAREFRFVGDLPAPNTFRRALNLIREPGTAEIGSPREIARELVRRGWISGLAPAEFEPGRDNSTIFYRDPEVVGNAEAQLNAAAFDARREERRPSRSGT